MGTQPEVDVDLCTFEAEPGDRFVLCSDGVHGRLDRAALGAILCRPATAETLAASVVDEAVSRKTNDNATAMAPSPTAAATRLRFPLRTSPTANTPGRLVSSR